MAKKSIFMILAVIVLCLCCGICFAAENTSTNLGNELMDSIHKKGDSINNVVSGNVVKDAGNTMKDAVNNVGGAVNNAGQGVQNGVNDVKNGVENMGDDMNRNGRDAMGNYNTVRTEAETRVANSGLNTMTTTTWMWIILVVAAVIIIAAIWYYATQNNS